MTAEKRKIAILGGGVAAITTAMRLTDDANWRSRFESITLYQLGWRLGGKGATGRGVNGTIEEHGLHVWPGFYENSFKTIQAIYAAAARPPGSRLSDWPDGFSRHNFIGVMNQLDDGTWEPWMFDFPENNGEPGSGVTLEPLRGWFKRILEWCESRARGGMLEGARIAPLIVAAELVLDPANDREVIRMLRDVRARLARRLSDLSAELATGRNVLLALMGVTIVLGLLRDGVVQHGDLERLEDEDFSSWLRRHSGLLRCLALRAVWDPKKNPLVRGLYDFAFAYEDGDTTRPNFAAAPALRTIFRMCLTYKGAVFYKMNEGMGDTIFAPAYEALINRGVEIKFFHKVTNLGLSADGQSIETIAIDVQATLKDEGVYPALIDIPGCETSNGNVPCWPNHPRYEFLNEGDELQKDAIDLESFWTPWQAPEQITLEAGKHFDTVVFGISLGSVPFVCGELVTKSAQWHAMVDNVKTVSTQALQVWPRQTLPQLGWTKASPVLDAWVQPLNTWADMTLLIDSECWPPGAKPGSLAYFCGPRQGGIPPQAQHAFPAQAYAEVKQTAEQMLDSYISTLWPALGPSGLPPSDRLHVYHRANIDPSERYVLSLAGSAKHRLAANASGFDNLVLTGDWISNGYNAGCVEAATWSGIQAANTILGRPLNDGVISY